MRAVLNLHIIEHEVCNYFAIPANKLFAKTRKRPIVEKRQLFHYLSKKYTKETLALIGEHRAHLDHATVLHSIKTVENLIDVDKSFKDSVNEIEEKLDILVMCSSENQAELLDATKNIMRDVLACTDKEALNDVLKNHTQKLD